MEGPIREYSHPTALLFLSRPLARVLLREPRILASPHPPSAFARGQDPGRNATKCKENGVKKIAIVTATVLFAGAAACSQATPNQLLGTWTLDPATHPSSYCTSPLTFAAKSYTSPDLSGKVVSIPVTSIVAAATTYPTGVYVVFNEGANHLTFVLTTANRMVLDTYLQCTYVR
jgi:hypothetical protein